MDFASEQQGERLQFLGHLAGGLAHEIKNPLSTININLQLLREDWAEPATPKETRLVKKIDLLLHEVKRLETILNDFLNYTRGHRQNPQAVKINALLRQVCELMGPEVEHAGCSLRLFEGEDLPTLEADPKSLTQAVINLIKNALEAMPDGGDILLSTRLRGNFVEIRVTDTGLGIPAKNLDKIFDVYFSTKKSGTGLGLATTKRIVEEHGGSIHFVSEEGKGTSFSIELPAVPGLTAGEAVA